MIHTVSLDPYDRPSLQHPLTQSSVLCPVGFGVNQVTYLWKLECKVAVDEAAVGLSQLVCAALL